jgi:hypothetical protein
MIFQAHLKIFMALDVMLGWKWKVLETIFKILRFLSNFSAQNLLINSHQAHQIAAHPFHHLPMGLPDDNPSSFGHHCGIGCHAGLEGLASFWLPNHLISWLLIGDIQIIFCSYIWQIKARFLLNPHYKSDTL